MVRLGRGGTRPQSPPSTTGAYFREGQRVRLEYVNISRLGGAERAKPNGSLLLRKSEGERQREKRSILRQRFYSTAIDATWVKTPRLEKTQSRVEKTRDLAL